MAHGLLFFKVSGSRDDRGARLDWTWRSQREIGGSRSIQKRGESNRAAPAFFPLQELVVEATERQRVPD
jgi:hypothetical protein